MSENETSVVENKTEEKNSDSEGEVNCSCCGILSISKSKRKGDDKKSRDKCIPKCKKSKKPSSSYSPESYRKNFDEGKQKEKSMASSSSSKTKWLEKKTKQKKVPKENCRKCKKSLTTEIVELCSDCDDDVEKISCCGLSIKIPQNNSIAKPNPK
ncbi:hypothetical protein M569_16083 [Genlisea aurea]|uniref:Uncharacterized protein n=1 Tax=Genlisea aurea TaxID=192259 RepID=S8BVT2_9LAMI|nr:hypothetical protein M569_16083 [Genlisea aurea]